MGDNGPEEANSEPNSKDDPQAESSAREESPSATEARDTTEPTAAPAAGEGDEATPIDANSLRVDAHVAKELFGDLFTDSTSHGPTQFGSHNTMHNYFGKKPLSPTIDTAPDMAEVMAVHVPTGVDDHLDELLSQRSTACLVGPRNSGRYTTALAALARRHEPGSVYEIVLPTNVSSEVLAEKPDILAEQSGFVLRLAGEGHIDAMRKLAAVFRRRNSTLLLIKDEEPRRWDWHGAEARHHAPEPVAVFRSHLTFLLTDSQTDVLGRYLTEDVEVALKAAYGPKESVALARAVARAHPASEQTLHDILDRSQPKRRERAATILLPTVGNSGPRGRRASQHERTFRLSYAVFYRRPMHYVFEAAEMLLREVDSAALRPDWGSMALQHPVHDLLGDALKHDWEAGREAGNATLGGARTAWIRDSGLRGAIIDVAWHDFDGTRKSLLRWLNRLVEEGDDVMRRAAAETAGLLVHYDFARVHEDLVDEWAGSRRAAVRQAAAWTMTLSDMAGDVGPKVRAKLSEWCSGPSTLKRDTAARVYASGLEQGVLAWSMFDLAKIAGDKLQKRHHVVAEAVNQLYRPERADWIITELDNWRQTPLLQVHAARAFVALSGRVEPDAADGRPDLLQRLVDGKVGVESLGRLWHVAFLEPDTAPSAARALARWVRHADANDESRSLMADLVNVIAPVPVMRRRILFYLARTSDFSSGIPSWIREEGRRHS